MKQETIKILKCKCASKRFYSCHVQQVNNLYVFIIMIFIDSDSYRYLEYYTIHLKKIVKLQK